jgi:hypothetical protein
MVPMNQRIIIADLDFTVLRFCVLAGFLRLVIRDETRAINWNRFDKHILLWSVSGSVVYVLQWGDIRSVIYKSGTMFDCLGMYYLFRHCIQSWDDISYVIKYFAIFAIISAPLIFAERIMESSIYSIFGPVGATFHRGRFRCAGPFPHSIMMGLFWANLLPLFYAQIKAGLNKTFYWVAIVSALTCIYLSGSSTPFMSVVAICMFWALYRYHKYGKRIFLGVCVVLAALHVVMKAPVWHLMSRVSFFDGSTGWHRYKIFDEFVNHISDWILLGCRDTSQWSSYHGMGDITNQYMIEGIRGGVITLILFIIIIYLSVQIPGKANIVFQSKHRSWLCWGISVSVLGHIVSFWGVSYFGQIIMLLYLTFVVVAFVQEQMETTLMRTSDL